jgi:threonine aldolase
MMGKWLDLRSDTVTWPTPAMRKAMAEAEVGDDVYEDDPTVKALEERAALLLGKEAALFVASGTMGNQLAIMAQTQPTDEVILSDRCHIVWHEAGAAALLSQVQLRCLPVQEGKMDLTQIAATIRKTPEDIHSPTTRLICLENADSDGRVLDLSYLEAVHSLAAQHQIAVHLDGARLFNAAVSLGVPAAAMAREADTVMFCLSKGLCAPVGSVLTGPAPVIARARRRRKILGGGMRQAGILAAAGLIALDSMTGRLAEDHLNARQLASRLAGLGDRWFAIERPPEINMVFFRLNRYPRTAAELVSGLYERGIRINPEEDGVFRLVCHYWVTPADLDLLLQALLELAAD